MVQKKGGRINEGTSMDLLPSDERDQLELLLLHSALKEQS